MAAWLAVGLYLKHVGVFVMAVLHHHSVVPGQGVGDTVLAFTVHRLEHKQRTCFRDWICSHNCNTVRSFREGSKR